MKLKISQNMLTGVSNRFIFLKYLKTYLKSSEWKKRRKDKLKNVGFVSEISGLNADVVHHIIYPFKNISDFKNIELWGSENDTQLLALTNEEHDITHSDLQHLAHKPRKLKDALKAYFDFE